MLTYAVNSTEVCTHLGSFFLNMLKIGGAKVSLGLKVFKW